MTQWGLDVLFNPAKRHMDEEKQRLQSTREEAGDASKGNRIDLASGKVTIRRKAAADDAAEAAEAPRRSVTPTADPSPRRSLNPRTRRGHDALTDATYAAETANPSTTRRQLDALAVEERVGRAGRRRSEIAERPAAGDSAGDSELVRGKESRRAGVPPGPSVDRPPPTSRG